MGEIMADRTSATKINPSGGNLAWFAIHAESLLLLNATVVADGKYYRTDLSVVCLVTFGRGPKKL